MSYLVASNLQLLHDCCRLLLYESAAAAVGLVVVMQNDALSAPLSAHCSQHPYQPLTRQHNRRAVIVNCCRILFAPTVARMSASAAAAAEVAIEYDHGSDVQPAVSWTQPNTASYPTLPTSITAPPAAPAPSQPAPITADATVNVLVEGKARIPYTGDEGVFYNKVQVFNRDLSILCITTFVHERQREWTAEREEREKRRRKQKETEANKRRQETDKAEREEKMEVEHSSNSSSNSSSARTSSHSRASGVDPAGAGALIIDASNTASSVPAFPGIRILEALSATGLRSIRYWLEIPNVRSIVINDLDATAVQSIRTNLAYNNLTSPHLLPTQSDAKLLMYNSLAPNSPSTDPTAAGPYDVIDLDPYGSACEFFDSSVQTVADGGLLCITCTDKAVLCGSWGEVAFAKYGGYALKGKTCHEMALRLVLGALQSAAGRYRRYIVPLLSLSIDFYVRLFVRVYEGQVHVKDGASKMGVVYQCTGCEAMYPQRLGRLALAKDGKTTKHSAALGPPTPTHCPDCASTFRIGGPVYLDALHDTAFITSALEYAEQHKSDFSTYARIHAMLNVARKELATPFYVCLSHLCHVLHAPQPKIWLLRAALIHAGYAVSDTHALPDGIKTTASPSVVWDILRCYVRQSTEPKGKPADDTVAGHILSKEPLLKADFSYVDGCDSSTKSTGMAKFLPNPENHWGPKERAKSKRSEPAHTHTHSAASRAATNTPSHSS